MIFEVTLEGVKYEGKLITWERLPIFMATLQNIMKMRETDLATITKFAAQSNAELSA